MHMVHWIARRIKLSHTQITYEGV